MHLKTQFTLPNLLGLQWKFSLLNSWFLKYCSEIFEESDLLFDTFDLNPLKLIILPENLSVNLTLLTFFL